MVKVDIVCVGKLKEKFFVEASQEYLKRLKTFCKIKIIEVPEYKHFGCPNLSQVQKILNEEGNNILKVLNEKSFKVSLCIEGCLKSSEELAKNFSELVTTHGKNYFTFIIGGSYGLSSEVKKHSDAKLSISPLTFPHQLARVILLEQLYRTFTIQLGKTYHK